MRKGISPLVATVILIAATMSIAGILSLWVGTFIPKTLEGAENATEESTCGAALFRVYSGTYSSTDKKLVLILENQRLMRVNLDNLYLFYSNSDLRNFDLNGTIAGNELKTFNISNVENGFSEGEIRSTCPGIAAKFNCNTSIRCT